MPNSKIPNSIYYKLVFTLLVILASFALISVKSLTVRATTPGIVINELMYHAASDEDDDDFLELFNTSNLPIDVSGWCFKGITLCFGNGTIIQPYEYAIVSRNTTRTQNIYGVTPIANYTGNLSNSGETIILKDSVGNVIDEVTYSDRGEWPTTPDGSGPSLELRDPISDHSLPSSWAASLNNGGTPGAKNSVSMVNLPTITDVSKYTIVQPNEAANITAKVENASSIKLVYKTMFNSEITVDMHDDGNHQDDATNDGVYGATIPGQAAGGLVRYRIVAINNDGTTSSPGNDDTINYYPYIIDDGQTADIPIVRWYIDPTYFDDMTTNHLTDKQQFSTVIAVGDQIFDNAKVRIKGQSSVSFPKKKYKFELPKGYELKQPFFNHPVKEFSIQVYMLNFIDLQEGLMWKSFKEAGFTELQNRYVRVHKNNEDSNSQFYGHYLLIENYDGNWRKRNNYESGALYKEANTKKTRKDEDNSDIQELIQSVTTLNGNQLKEYLFNNLNIPAIINYHAVVAVTSSTDWHGGKNIYEYRDTEGTGRWEYLPWDLDNGFLPSLFKEYRSVDFLRTPIINQVSSSNLNSSSYYNNSIIEKAMYQFPEFREMFFRRSMNLYDQIWGSDKYMMWFDEMFDRSVKTMEDDAVVWNPYRQALVQGVFPDGLPWNFLEGTPGVSSNVNPFESIILQTPHDLKDVYIFGATKHKDDVSLARQQGQLLGVQTSLQESKIKINEIMYNSVDGQEYNFVELYNSGNDPVDLSSWKVSGLGFTFSSGTVLPAKGFGLIVKNDKLFRAKYPGKFVLGEYSGNLSLTGEELALKDTNGKIIYSVKYGINDPWPASPSEEGKSLSLVKDNGNASNPACWAPSANTGGTPGQINDFDEVWLDDHANNCDEKANNQATIKNEMNDHPVQITTPESSNITCFESIDSRDFTKKDASYEYPLGLIKFCFDTYQTDNQITLSFITDLMPNQVKPRKYNPNTKTYSDLPTSVNANITETTIDNEHALVLSYSITDNGELDLDPAIGKIKDPIGLAVTNEVYEKLKNTGTNNSIILIAAGGVIGTVLMLSMYTYRRRRVSYAAG